MDPYYGPARVLYVTLLYSTHSISDFEGGRKGWPKITHPSTKQTKWAPPREPQPVLRPKKYNSWSSGSKIQKTSKNLKKPQFTSEFFFDLAPIPADTSAKILPIVVLLSTAVEKKTKIKHPNLQNGPTKGLFQSYIYRAFGRIVSYMQESCFLQTSLQIQTWHSPSRQIRMQHTRLYRKTPSTTYPGQNLTDWLSK